MCTQKRDMDVAAGQQVPGSRFVRAFCRGCGSAMRVSKEAYDSGCYAECADCTRPLHPGHGTSSSVDEYDGSWDNVVRALEERQ